MQPPCSLHTINFEHEVSGLDLFVVARLTESDEDIGHIALYPIIGALGHSYKPLINGPNE